MWGTDKHTEQGQHSASSYVPFGSDPKPKGFCFTAYENVGQGFSKRILLQTEPRQWCKAGMQKQVNEQENECETLLICTIVSKSSLLSSVEYHVVKVDLIVFKKRDQSLIFPQYLIIHAHQQNLSLAIYLINTACKHESLFSSNDSVTFQAHSLGLFCHVNSEINSLHRIWLYTYFELRMQTQRGCVAKYNWLNCVNLIDLEGVF